eukprot:15861171-Heterocapsa_arctica.AAC.1
MLFDTFPIPILTLTRAMTKDMFGPQLLTKDGLKPTDEVLADKKFVSIYFSAHWCPPCRGFTPVAAEKYNQAKELGEW